jgi:hypothetical protein
MTMNVLTMNSAFLNILKQAPIILKNIAFKFAILIRIAWQIIAQWKYFWESTNGIEFA